MSNTAPISYSPTWAGDDRVAPPLAGGERETLVACLDHARRTFELKCLGLTAEQLSTKAVPPSALSLHGLVRHLAGVERWWFRIQFAGEELPLLHYTDDNPDSDFEDLDGDPELALQLWREECTVSRGIVAAATSLDQTGTRRRDGAAFSLRWLLCHHLEEYARHNGHADLLRERLDGRTGA
ncbi:MAG TPA: DinB family protein [Segeticoccus sp.]|uniref:DinB family protein n=1 Tax=Segeticoccus sp. TaxID=2706531 RepID=UPI002D809946|nr:DinB family protein [Segeticoccus sp.]HET8601106.1 DinB family protein [Segeticoccus sp.]